MQNPNTQADKDMVTHVTARMVENNWLDRTSDTDVKTRNVALLLAAAADKWGVTSQEILDYLPPRMASEILDAMEAEYQATQIESAPVV